MNAHRILLPIATALFLLTPSFAAAEVVVTNHKSGSSVRYSVVLLRGKLSADVSELAISNANAPASAKPVNVVTGNGQFKALVELSAGANNIELSDVKSSVKVDFKIDYRPMTNPHYVRLIWLTDNTGDTTFAAPNNKTPQDYEQRLRTAGLLMQTFTAERTYDLGFGRRTFRLEKDEAGQVVVHTLKAPENAEHYYALGDSNRYWGDIYRWINREHPDPHAKNVVLAAFTRKDMATGKMRGHTALGGGNLGLFGSASVFSWPRDISSAATVFIDASLVDPKQVHDDSAGRGTHWGLASTTIGATLHEMGHTFGLPHCKDGLGIMTRGFDHFNRVFTLREPRSLRGQQRDFSDKQEAYFAPVSASFLQWSRWFQQNPVDYESNEAPVIKIDREKEIIRITSASGVPWVGYWVGADIYEHQEFNQANPPKEVEIKLADVDKLLTGRMLSKVSTIGANGLVGSSRIQQGR